MLPKTTLLLILIYSQLASAQRIKDRVYTPGKTFTYQLTTQTWRNNQPDARSVAVSLHTVTEENNIPGEKVRWMLKTVYTQKAATRDSVAEVMDTIAQRVTPYFISLDPKGTLAIPPLMIPSMTGEITDLNTFYVAISPSLHCDRLNKKNPSFSDSVLHGNFADGREIIRGEDRIQVTQKLVSQNKKTSVIETSFTPPPTLSITPFIDTIGKQTFDTPNNFQMVRKGFGDKVNLMWGVETFIITSTIDNDTRQLLKAEMTNTLQLRMRFNSAADLSTYDAEIPLTIKRVLHLQLLK
jgi:hypothetical protein